MNLVLFSSFYDSKNVRDFIQKKSKSANPKICYIPSFTSFHGLQAFIILWRKWVLTQTISLCLMLDIFSMKQKLIL